MADPNIGVKARHAAYKELLEIPEFKAKYEEIFARKRQELSSSSGVAVGIPPV